MSGTKLVRHKNYLNGFQAVGKAAMDMVQEVRRQFRDIPGIMEYKAKPEYEKCVAISTKASIREMLMPGAIALITPVIVGFIFGPEVLGSWRDEKRHAANHATCR